MDALVDANVWFPILLERHEHHRAASDWWNAAPAGSATWCRTTQLAILRLLTNQTVIGTDVMHPEAAWDTWQRLSHDERTAFLAAEPAGIDLHWRANLAGRVPTPKLWADAYLAALAETAGLEMVTFDRGFRQFSLTRLTLLTP